MEKSLSYFIDALLAYNGQAFTKALLLTEKAAQTDPNSLFYQQAAKFLRKAAETKSVDVYVSPQGFETFIRGGGNLPLYENTSALLRAGYRETGSKTLLDIGVGDGYALLPALSDQITELDLVEPSEPMLEKLASKLKNRGATFRAHPMRWQQFRDQIAAAPRPGWDMIQMTFSAHTFLPEERLELLTWCAQHCKQMMLVEFDVPLFSNMLSPKVIRYYVAKYERGLTEYKDEAVVMQEFLMPVFFGNFAHDSERVTFEQPAENWHSALHDTGFSSIQKEAVFDYWWAPAFMLKAEGKG